MSERPDRGTLSDAVAAQRRARMVSGLRTLSRAPVAPSAPVAAAAGGPAGPPAAASGPAGPLAATSQDFCDICGTTIPADHRHLLALAERQIVCSCETCWGLRAGEGDWRPVGNRTLWLDDLRVPDDVWAGFQIPIGLAFFMVSTVTDCVVAMYPSPAGATESELRFDTWQRLVALNPVLEDLEPDVEGLVVNRLAEPPVHAIAPIDRCYALTGAIKASWEGISGGAGVDTAVADFFDGLRAQATV